CRRSSGCRAAGGRGPGRGEVAGSLASSLCVRLYVFVVASELKPPMADRDQSSYASAAELARRIRSRELSPVELMTSTIQRIEQRNPSLNAFAFTDFDQAMERARAAESAVTSGATLGPLHGVPTAIT